MHWVRLFHADNAGGADEYDAIPDFSRPRVCNSAETRFTSARVAFPPAKSPSAILTGVVERIIFLNEENHYTIAELRPDAPVIAAAAGAAASKARPEAVTIVGPLPGVECGETLHLTGEWARHAQHGAQFKIAAFKSELPASVY